MINRLLVVLAAVLLVAAVFAGTAFAAQPASDLALQGSTCGDTYTVQPGDWLLRIARECGTTTQAILDANPSISDANLLYVGQQLAMPGSDTGDDSDTTLDEAQIYFVALEDGGVSGDEIGCGDSIVPVTVTFDSTPAPLTAALEQLVSEPDEFYGQSGLYNALSDSNLTVDDVTINPNDVAIVELSGDLSLGGVCDTPRVESQLLYTALQFSTVDDAVFYLNGEPISDALSGRGEGGPAVSITPRQGLPGTSITVMASGFPANTTATVGVGRSESEPTTSTEVLTDASGSFSTEVTIPEGEADFGEPWAVVVLAGGEKAVSQNFRVTGSGITATTTVNLRLRSGPSTDFEQIGLAPAGTTVFALGRNALASWIYVDYDGTEGWMAAWYTDIGADLADLPIVQ